MVGKRRAASWPRRQDYDLVLMDTAMRDLDGVETTKRIRGLHASVIAGADRGAVVANGMKSDRGDLSLRRHGRLCVEADPRARALCGARALPWRAKASEPATLVEASRLVALPV